MFAYVRTRVCITAHLTNPVRAETVRSAGLRLLVTLTRPEWHKVYSWTACHQLYEECRLGVWTTEEPSFCHSASRTKPGTNVKSFDSRVLAVEIRIDDAG